MEEENYSAAELLIREGVNINAGDMDGWTPLHMACHCQAVDMVQLLLNVSLSPLILHLILLFSYHVLILFLRVKLHLKSVDVRCSAFYITFKLLICLICSNELFLKLNMELKYPKHFKTVNVHIPEE